MKKLFLYCVFIFIVMVILTIIIFVDDNSIYSIKNDDINIKLKELNNIDKKIDYFNYKLIDRYIAYKRKNLVLSDIDIVTRVNLNLDFPYYQNTSISDRLNLNDILINKYIYLPSDYVPDNLVSVENGKMLVNYVKDAFLDMQKKASDDGYNIRLMSGYRSYDYQKKLYDNYVLSDGVVKADTYSARPGFSEHQTGLVIDIDNGSSSYEDFENTKEFKWMQDNCYKYGFILRYPKGKEDITGYSYESWHYRYVGLEIAKFIYENKLSFDEYYVRFIKK